MSKLVLIVDDSEVLRQALRFSLEKLSLEVVDACDGCDGLKRLSELEQEGKHPSLIITDVNMPNMDGITFVGEVKKTPSKTIPILILTTESQADKKTAGKNAGASGWLVKPFTDEQLAKVVKKFVR